MFRQRSSDKDDSAKNNIDLPRILLHGYAVYDSISHRLVYILTPLMPVPFVTLSGFF